MQQKWDKKEKEKNKDPESNSYINQKIQTMQQLHKKNKRLTQRQFVSVVLSW